MSDIANSSEIENNPAILRQLWLDRFMFISLTICLLGFYLLPGYKTQANIYYSCVLAPFLLFRFSFIRTVSTGNPLLALCCVFILYYGTSGLWTVGEPERPIYKAFVYMVYVIVFLASVVYFSRHRESGGFNAIYRHAMVIAGAFCGILSAVVFYQPHAFPAERLEPFINPLNLIIFGQLLGLSAVFSCLLTYNNANKPMLGYLVFCFVVCFFCLFLTQSRGPLLGFAAAFALYAILARQRTVIYLAIGLAASLLAYAVINEGELAHRLFSTESPRSIIYNNVFQNIRGHEIFGMGLMTGTDKELGGWGYPHSMPLATYYYSGLIGLSLLLVLLGFSLHGAWKIFKINNNPWGLTLLVYGIFTFLFDGDKLLSHPHILWLFIWHPIALIAAEHPRT